MSQQQFPLHANSEELHLEFEFREIYMRKSYEYAKQTNNNIFIWIYI